MFKHILIANRGAIAVRIIRTLKSLGVESVAVYAEADKDSLHVQQADQAYSLGEGPARDTYLDQDKLMAVIRESGAEAVHPGYGFLSENAGFVERCEAEGVVFLGPTIDQMAAFGLKHRARALAEASQVPLLPGSDLLQDLDAALEVADEIGYPVMLKSTAGGGGIGMQRCDDAAALQSAFDSVRRLAGNHFADDGVFLEKFVTRARHIEVQIFGDGEGQVVALGERDCSAQRRNQKVIEETPAPNIPETVRQRLHLTAIRLGQAVNYRSAGTVEFVYDGDEDQFYFLEVNTRLQVEHGVTEEVYGVDLVAWMVQLGAGDLPQLAVPTPQGHAIQVRLYAEDPALQFQPCAGLLSQVDFPLASGLRIDTWVESGSEVSPLFDPMLAKLIVHADSREAALIQLKQALEQSTLYGIETNQAYLAQLLADPVVAEGAVSTSYLAQFAYQPQTLAILTAGTQTTIQDGDGRRGYWDVGVPPSGPFDSRSFALGNRLLGNQPDAAGLEITLRGPTVRFSAACSFVITGAEIQARLDDQPVALWQVVHAEAGQQLALGDIRYQGSRAYLLVAGGIDCPRYLGSRSTFTLGQFGGHNGRALRSGDVLHLAAPARRPNMSLDSALRPAIHNQWTLRVLSGPHGAPDFFTAEDIAEFFAAEWEVHYNSSRTGVRLIGPKPHWARSDGGEAGLHPSNIHDNAYAFGTVDFTGDMPVILGPDGPSLGGFVCPATVVHADLWKLGQLRAGDKVRFQAIDLADALRLAEAEQLSQQALQPHALEPAPVPVSSPVIARHPASDGAPEVTYRLAGDRFLLLEYGEQVLDVALRFRVHALMQWLQQQAPAGLLELTPGVRSLQVHYDPVLLPLPALLDILLRGERQLGDLSEAEVPSRIVHLPLSWDDEACRLAIEKYMQSVRPDAPWCPSNIEFIRRINGLDSVEAVKRILFEASYLVLGLGDVYLGAPVATPLDPRHRLVTTKYNPARTWTAENSVGIGGAYLCVYGMEGPGGYQFVGRTLQMWNRFRQTDCFDKPWLLRFFDQIRFYPVSAEELVEIREQFPRGQYPLKIESSRFSLKQYQAFLAENQAEIATFEARRDAAFGEELERWREQGHLTFDSEHDAAEEAEEQPLPADCQSVESHVAGSVWRWLVEPGESVSQGQTLAILESMKMEIPLTAPAAGTVHSLRQPQGSQINAGQSLLVLLVLQEVGAEQTAQAS